MTEKNSPRSFVLAFIGLTAFAFVAMVAFNIIVDPFWRFDLVRIAGFNAQKNQFPAYERLAKAGVICRVQPATIVLGTSRVEVGINPQSAAFSVLPGPVYNVGLAGAGLHELDVTMRHAAFASPRLKHVLLGLDFLMFNAHREASVFNTEVFNFDAKRLLSSNNDSCLRSFLYDADLLLGPRGLVFSVATIAGQISEPIIANASLPQFQTWTGMYDPSGFRSNFYLLQKLLVPKGGYRGLFGPAQEAYYVARVWRPPPKQRYCFGAKDQPNTIAVFRGMLDFARASGIDLRIFINPVHARLILAVREGGLWPQYQEWKRALVQAVAEEAAASGKPAFQLWDFSGFNSVTSEHIPDKGDFTTIMHGYWEASHYKSETGDLLLRKMLRHPNADSVPNDFGQRLTPESIESWIVETRNRMRTYTRREAFDADLIKTVVEQAMTGSAGANCGHDVEALREASAAQARGDTAAADAAFQRAIEIHEADRRRFAELDVPYRESGFAKVMAQVKAGVELKPLLRDWIAYQERGIDRSSKGDLAGAIEDFSDAIRLGPANTALFFLRGTTRLRAGNNPGAAEDFEAGLKLDPTNATLKNLLSQARSSAPAKTAATSSPVNPKLAAELQNAADAKRKAGNLAGAIADYSKAIAVSPPNTALYYLRGTARLQSGDRPGAAADFEEGLKLDPANTALKTLLSQARAAPVVAAPVPVPATNLELAAQLQNAADAKRKAGDLAGAIADYSKAIEVSPPNTALHYSRGTARMQTGDRLGAAKDFEEGLKLDPENVTLKSLLNQTR